MTDLLLPASQGLGFSPSPTGVPPTNGADDGAGDEGIDLRELFAIFRRHWLLILGVAFGVAAITAVFAYRTKPVYRANAVVRITDARAAMTAGIDNATPDGIGIRTDPVLSQIQVLESRGVAGEVIRRHPVGLRVIPLDFPASMLHDVAVDSGTYKDTLSFEFGDKGYQVHSRAGTANGVYGTPVSLGLVRFRIDSAPKAHSGRVVVRPTETAIDNLLNHLDAEPRKSTDVIDVSYTDTDPAIAQEVVNVAIVAFQQANAATAQEQSRRRRQFVGEQLAQTDSLLQSAQVALSEFASSRGVYGSDQVIAAQQTGLMDLDVKRGEMVAERSVYQALLDSLQHATGQHLTERLNAVVSSPGIAQNPVIVTLYQQLVRYEAMRDSLTTSPWSGGAGSPDVKRLDTLVTTTQRRLTDATRSQIEAVAARITALDSLKVRAAADLKRLPAIQVAEARLAQQVGAARKVSDQLSDEFQKARIEEAVEAGQVEVIDRAALPTIPIGRGPLFLTLLGLVFGLVFGAGSAFVSENLNRAIQHRDDIEKVLQVPGLAVIPQILPSQATGRLKLAGLPIPSSKRSLPAATGSYGSSLVATDLRSTGAEAFRTLRTNLIFSQAVQSLHAIAITSAIPSEGKTTTTANLAVTFAQQGLRVLLVDGDLRKPRMHEVFGQPREPGLTSVLVNQANIDQTIRATSVDRLFLLPSGPLPPNPAELLGGARMKELIVQLRQSFDIVLFDLPPVHVAADALILGREADGVLMVVRAGRTDRDAAQSAMRSLASVGARVVGAVLNDPDHKLPLYGGYYYYYDYYGDDKAKVGNV